MLADGEKGIGICILGGRGLPWQMTVVYAAFCSCSLQPLFLLYSHIRLDPGVNTGGLQFDNLCSHFVAGRKVKYTDNPIFTEVAKISF